MATGLFQAYSFKNPHSNYVEAIDGWSYVWAAVFGPFYLVVKQFWGLFFLYALVLQPVLTVAAFFAGSLVGGAIAIAMTMAGYDVSSEPLTAFVGVLFVPLYFIAVSKMTIAGARKGYLRMGWQQQ